MASRREIKKDVNFLTYEVVSDCYIFIYQNKDNKKKTDKAINLINKIIDTRKDLIHRINNVETKDKKSVKQHYKKIYNDLLKNVDDSFKELSKLSK